MRHVRFGLVLTALLLQQGPAAVAQTTSQAPIKIVVAHPPGGVTDVLARLLAQKVGAQIGAQVVVDNKPGASGILGSDFVAKAAPDGRTLMVFPDTNAIVPALNTKLSWDLNKDFAPIALLAVSAPVIVAHPSFAPTTLQEVISHAKKNPGEPFASPGGGSVHHLAMEMLQSEAGIQLRHVPYKGGGQAVADVVAGHVKFAILGIAPALPFLRTGQLKAIAVTGEKRAEPLPAVPTVAESGFPGFNASQWFAVAAPAGTPEPVIRDLHANFVKAVRDPEVVQRLAQAGVEVRTSSPAELGKFLAQEVSKWPPIVKARGIKAE